jgi:hypothetical protein
MHSGMIGKIEKAHRYAEERGRFDVQALAVTVHGNNGDHRVVFGEGQWRCECDFFLHNAQCAHTMALELILDGMLKPAVAA